MARSKAGNAILGGLKDCADSARLKDAGIFALKFGLYAVKVPALTTVVKLGTVWRENFQDRAMSAVMHGGDITPYK